MSFMQSYWPLVCNLRLPTLCPLQFWVCEVKMPLGGGLLTSRLGKLVLVTRGLYNSCDKKIKVGVQGNNFADISTKHTLLGFFSAEYRFDFSNPSD